MKRIVVILVMLTSTCTKAQNLISNGGFENLTSCTLPFFSPKLVGWCDYSGYEYLFNTCVPVMPGLVGSVPSCYYKMFQYPRTGNGFCAIAFYSNFGINNRRGYIQTQLTQPLTINKKYLVKFYVNLTNDSEYAVDKICALLTNTPIACNTGTFTTLLDSPQIINKNGIITDTLNWVEICDTMSAVGNEQYLIIGNFFSDANTNVSLSYPSGIEYIAHYNIDDVSVEELIPASCIKDTILCSGESVQLGLNQTETATYNWQPSAGLSCVFCANPIAQPGTTTTYVLTKHDCNIITKDSVTIIVKNDCNITEQIPNVFTPNGDGLNDVWEFSLGIGNTLNSITVYNRWGNEMLNDKLRMKNQIRWDGRTTSGEACTGGVYFYTLEYTTSKGDKIKKNGYLSLFR